MAVKSVTLYWIECDDCGAQKEDYFDAMDTSKMEAIKQAEYWDWLVTDDGCWCSDCRAKHEEEVCGTTNDWDEVEK